MYGIQGYHIDESRDERNGQYTTLCSHCAEARAGEDPTLDLEADYIAPIFSDSESDCIECCEHCGEVLEHNLTGDCDSCQYESVSYVTLQIVGNRAEFRISPYSGSDRVYTDLTDASIVRIWRLIIDRIMWADLNPDRGIQFHYTTDASAGIGSITVMYLGWTLTSES